MPLNPDGEPILPINARMHETNATPPKSPQAEMGVEVKSFLWYSYRRSWRSRLMFFRWYFLIAITVFQLTASQQFGLQENFATQGTKLNTAVWTAVTGPASYLGRTQLQDWITPGGSGKFVVDGAGAELSLQTYNPTGYSLYGTQGQTIASFQPIGGGVIEFHSRLQLTSIQPGLVYGMYLYGCAPSSCATQHDEIDIEVLTNS